MNPYYWPNPFAYLGWGHHKFLPIDMLIRQTWSKRMQYEMDYVHQSSIKYLYYLTARADDCIELSPYFENKITHEVNCF
jgi:hypothetical protein